MFTPPDALCDIYIYIEREREREREIEREGGRERERPMSCAGPDKSAIRSSSADRASAILPRIRLHIQARTHARKHAKHTCTHNTHAHITRDVPDRTYTLTHPSQ